jgi:hypothetical protein
MRTDTELKNRLTQMKARCSNIVGRAADGRQLCTVVAEAFDALLNDTTTPEERAAFLSRAENDRYTRQQLCALRVEQANNFIYATQNIIPMFYEIVNLANDERPVFQNNTMQEVRVGYIGQDGASDTAKIIKPQDEVLIDLNTLATDEIRYRKVDIYSGSVVDAALQTIKLAYDMGNQMEGKAFDLLTSSVVNGGAFGTFTFTGSKPSRVYMANSRIKTALLPTTNDISLSDNGTGSGQSNAFRYGVLRAAKKYSDQWGKAFPEGPLTPTGRILVPGAEASDLAIEITPSGTTRNKVADQLLEQGYATIDYLGVMWQIVPDNTISSGACYVEMNRKPGTVFLKPSHDKEKISDSYENDRNNEEARYMTKVFGAYINSPRRINALRIIYSSTYSTSTP